MNRGDRTAEGRREHLAALIRRFRETDSAPACALDHGTPFQLLAAVILSAQCTDARVNAITPALFARFPDPPAMAAAEPAELEGLVRTAGLFRNKARHLRESARQIVERFGGEVPRTMAELTSLPGVARKTANVVLGNAFGRNEGVAVDTHVFRLARRLGLSEAPTPAGVEQNLMDLAPRAEWAALSHWLIRLGRSRCTARRPDCPACPFSDLCPRHGVEP